MEPGMDERTSCWILKLLPTTDGNDGQCSLLIFPQRRSRTYVHSNSLAPTCCALSDRALAVLTALVSSYFNQHEQRTFPDMKVEEGRGSCA